MCEHVDFGHRIDAELRALVQERRQHGEVDFPNEVLGSGSNGSVYITTDLVRTWQCYITARKNETEIDGQGIALAFKVGPALWEGVIGALDQSRFRATAWGSLSETSEEGKEGKSSGHWRMLETRRGRSRREYPTGVG